MIFAVPICVMIIASFIAYLWSDGKSVRRKYVIWGTVFMVAIAPCLSFLIGIIFANIVGDGFAGGMMMVLVFIGLFLIGLFVLVIGIVKKQKDVHT
ncbi:hypothetical protein ACGTN9_13040 [Halobacillus sp. MO56]